MYYLSVHNISIETKNYKLYQYINVYIVMGLLYIYKAIP